MTSDEQYADAMSNLPGLASALRSQRQIDEDGSEVGVSRQACDYAATVIERLCAVSAQPVAIKELSDEQIDAIAARIGSLSLNATRLHELGGETTTIFQPKGLIEFARAILAASRLDGANAGEKP